jgi:hypothetical protein
MVFQLLVWAWVPMHFTKDFIMEAVPVAQAAAKKNEIIHMHFKLNLLFMNALTLKRKKHSEEVSYECISMIISVNDKILLTLKKVGVPRNAVVFFLFTLHISFLVFFFKSLWLEYCIIC